MKNSNNIILSVFGDSLRRIRKTRNMSQEELAYICELDRTYISGLERGVRNPTLKVIATLAACLETTPSKLLSEIGNENEKNNN